MARRARAWLITYSTADGPAGRANKAVLYSKAQLLVIQWEIRYYTPTAQDLA